MTLSDDIISKLQPLKGMNLDTAFKNFRENKIFAKRRGFAENVIALLINRELPRNERGADFQGLFEVKEIKVKYTIRKGEMRTGGDTAISSYMPSEADFFKSNIWDKSTSILIVCVNQDKIVVDVKYFDGNLYAEQMKNDYESIKKYKNLCRKNNKILVFKTGRNSIMLKGNTALDKSESIIYDNTNNIIIDQQLYINNLFSQKFSFYQNVARNSKDRMIYESYYISFSDWELIKIVVDRRFKEKVGFDLNSGSELPF